MHSRHFMFASDCTPASVSTKRRRCTPNHQPITSNPAIVTATAHNAANMYRSSIYPAKDNSDHLPGQAGKENARSGPGVARYRKRPGFGLWNDLIIGLW